MTRTVLMSRVGMTAVLSAILVLYGAVLAL